VQFIETEMGLKVDPRLISMMGGFLPMEMVVKGKSACFLAFGMLWLKECPCLLFVELCFIYGECCKCRAAS